MGTRSETCLGIVFDVSLADVMSRCTVRFVTTPLMDRRWRKWQQPVVQIAWPDGPHLHSLFAICGSSNRLVIGRNSRTQHEGRCRGVAYQAANFRTSLDTPQAYCAVAGRADQISPIRRERQAVDLLA